MRRRRRATSLSPHVLFLILVGGIILVARNGVQAERVARDAVYGSSYVFLDVRNRRTGASARVCANYLQYKTRALPSSPEEAQPESFRWWADRVNNTNVCAGESGKNYSGASVAVNYRLERSDGACAEPFVRTDLAFRNASQFEVNQLAEASATSAILLLDRGKRFLTRWRDFLFSEFTDPYIDGDTAPPTFFLYRDVFYDRVVASASDPSELEMRWWRPSAAAWDWSMLVIWLIATGCVAGGGLWAWRAKALEDEHALDIVGHTRRTGDPSSSPTTTTTGGDPLDGGESATTASPSTGGALPPSSSSSSASCCARHANSLVIALIMVVLVGILMLGYLYRDILVWVFNVLLTIIGTTSVYDCTMALLSNCCRCRAEIGIPLGSLFLMNRLPCCRLCAETRVAKIQPKLLNCAVFVASASLCLTWFFTRSGPYAFILLDIINVTLSLKVLKSLRLPSLKWITALMGCMFVYDLFMVFVTPFLTPSGCSVMLEVATGVDCSAASQQGYPTPPVDAHLPDKFPMLMQFLHIEPMLACIDLSVERGFHNIILGLGDIIIPGYLVSYCFTLAGHPPRVRLLYGAASTAGYGVGLVCTFVALSAMGIAQPALIYLVPCTLAPVILVALWRRELHGLWHGTGTTLSSHQTLGSGQSECGGVKDEEAARLATASPPPQRTL